MTQKSQKAAPGWREFEKLAAEIEEILAPNGAEVTCPDRIPDLDTGELREVDASIRYTVGSVPILIILECRDRKSRQGTMWIEQLASKRASVGAAKCVAISRSPFTRPAQLKAKKLGVELRNLRRYQASDISDIAPMVGLHYLCSFNRVSLTFDQGFELGDPKLAADYDDNLNKVLWSELGYSIESKIIRYDKSEKVRSVAEFLMNIIDGYYAWNAGKEFFVPRLGENYVFSFAGRTKAEVEINDVVHKLGGAAFWVKFSSFFDSQTKIDSATFYSSEQSLLASKMELTVTTSNGSTSKSCAFQMLPNSEKSNELDRYGFDPKLLFGDEGGSLQITSVEAGKKLGAGRFEVPDIAKLRSGRN